jgi:hypothetical protein
MTSTKECPFCHATETVKQADFGTSLMVAVHFCPRCRSYFEAIKWGDNGAKLDIPGFLDDPAHE